MSALSSAIFRRSGPKQELCGSTQLEQDAEAAKLDYAAFDTEMKNLHDILHTAKTGRDLSAAIWRAELGVAELVLSRRQTGQSRKHFLHIEEAVFLVDRADLLLFVEQPSTAKHMPASSDQSDLLHGNASKADKAAQPQDIVATGRWRLLSLQECYELMELAGVALERYLVYSSLSRSGYLVMRYPSCWVLEGEQQPRDVWGHGAWAKCHGLTPLPPLQHSLQPDSRLPGEGQISPHSLPKGQEQWVVQGCGQGTHPGQQQQGSQGQDKQVAASQGRLQQQVLAATDGGSARLRALHQALLLPEQLTKRPAVPGSPLATLLAPSSSSKHPPVNLVFSNHQNSLLMKRIRPESNLGPLACLTPGYSGPVLQPGLSPPTATDTANAGIPSADGPATPGVCALSPASLPKLAETSSASQSLTVMPQDSINHHPSQPPPAKRTRHAPEGQQQQEQLQTQELQAQASCLAPQAQQHSSATQQQGHPPPGQQQEQEAQQQVQNEGQGPQPQGQGQHQSQEQQGQLVEKEQQRQEQDAAGQDRILWARIDLTAAPLLPPFLAMPTSCPRQGPGKAQLLGRRALCHPHSKLVAQAARPVQQQQQGVPCAKVAVELCPGELLRAACPRLRPLPPINWSCQLQGRAAASEGHLPGVKVARAKRVFPSLHCHVAICSQAPPRLQEQRIAESEAVGPGVPIKWAAVEGGMLTMYEVGYADLIKLV
ncbi:tRNA_int_end_N2 domain-containing protein [Haematococcus lacustris]|uniref:tRNA_int_end_N2 domain-containing protein n=1 Tax=Haematococcus lacustris TaxID=44745 RepID=A0A699YW16_HAELA|nr:tRNA_int_end_N2 domain-containing protein [Haematococcus lacustris]